MCSPLILNVWRALLASITLLAVPLNAAPSDTFPDWETTLIAELLVSDRANEIARGENDLAAQRSAVITNLLERCQSDEVSKQGNAAYELALIISPWIRGQENGARSRESASIAAPRRPVGRASRIAESEMIRSKLKTAITKLLTHTLSLPNPTSEQSLALKALCEALGEVADDTTMDWTTNLLQSLKSPDLAEPFLLLISSHLGLHPLFQRGGLCGNSSPEEAQRFDISEEFEVHEASARISKIWSEVHRLSPSRRITFAIKNWRDFVLPLQPSQSGHLVYQGWFFVALEPLIRFGAPAIDQLRAQQTRETALEAKAVWEVVIATITGQEDKALMQALFTGSDAQRELACDIAVGALSKNWLTELAELQLRPGFNQEKASQTIASCYRYDGIPALRDGVAFNKENSRASSAIKELDERAKNESLTGMSRYQFQ